ncbi:hypothetical protein AS593_07530 [Caulobacter vibrioides]|nr:hypothetical protein AS593_07530 [Caulobacter vibrioides]
MGARHDPSVLKQLAAVRRVQRLQAEMTLAAAEAAIRRLETRRGEAETVRDDHMARWGRVIAEPALGLSVAGACAAAVAHSESALAELAGELVHARSDKDDKLRALSVARAREDVAEDTARKAGRVERRAREQHRLSELADVASRRRARP